MTEQRHEHEHEHELVAFREPGFGFVQRWCEECGRVFASAAAHDEALACR